MIVLGNRYSPQADRKSLVVENFLLITVQTDETADFR